MTLPPGGEVERPNLDEIIKAEGAGENGSCGYCACSPPHHLKQCDVSFARYALSLESRLKALGEEIRDLHGAGGMISSERDEAVARAEKAERERDAAKEKADKAESLTAALQERAKHFEDVCSSALCMLAEGSDPQLMAAGVRPKKEATDILLDGFKSAPPAPSADRGAEILAAVALAEAYVEFRDADAEVEKWIDSDRSAVTEERFYKALGEKEKAEESFRSARLARDLRATKEREGKG